MKYIITPSQLHTIIYKHLDDMFPMDKYEVEVNPYDETGNTWRGDFHDKYGKDSMTFFYFAKTEDEDGNDMDIPSTSLYIKKPIVESLVKLFSVRSNKIMDIIADWVSEKLNADIDEIDIGR